MKLTLEDHIISWSLGGYTPPQLESQKKFVKHLESCKTCQKGIDSLCVSGLFLFNGTTKRIWYPVNWFKSVKQHPYLLAERFHLYDEFLHHVETCYECQWNAGGLCSHAKALRKKALNYNGDIPTRNTLGINPIQQVFNFNIFPDVLLGEN